MHARIQIEFSGGSSKKNDQFIQIKKKQKETALAIFFFLKYKRLHSHINTFATKEKMVFINE